MKTLLLDTSNTSLSIGIAIDNKLIYQNKFNCWQRQSELMIPEIEKALKETNIELVDINEIVCGIGPGSYTGVRIALTIAKVASLMNGAALKCISSLRMFGNINDKYIALMNARSNRSYIGVYDKDKVILQDTVLTNDEVKAYIESHKEYKVIGETSYLGIEGIIPNEIEGMMSLKDITNPVDDIMSIKPTYLKD